MSDSAFKIVRIMSGGYFNCTGSVVEIDKNRISNYFYNSVFNERMFKFASDNILVSCIVGVDSNSDITEHSFDTSGRNSNFIESFINESWIIFNFESFLGFFIVIFSWDLNSFDDFEAANFHKFRILSLS
jgi:hypothetical protein